MPSSLRQPMSSSYPDRNDCNRRSWSRPTTYGRARKLILWLTVGGLTILIGSHRRGESDANLANGNLRFNEYRAFFPIRTDEKETELSRLARTAGYRPPPDAWVRCKFYYAFGPFEERGNGWDMEAYNLIMNAGGIASLANVRGQPKPLQRYQAVFERLGRREYGELLFELEESMELLSIIP